MTSLREAAQQALEALDAYSWEQVNAARAALRTALAEPEQTFMAEYKFRTYGYYQDADGKMQVGEIPEEMLTVSVEELIEEAVLAEREACAKVCETEWGIDGQHTANEFAAAIRARGQE
jgi:hypothetical protein